MTYVPPTTIYPPTPPVLPKVKITRDPYIPLYCRHCGAYIPESSDVCVSCGKRIDSMPAKTKEKKQTADIDLDSRSTRTIKFQNNVYDNARFVPQSVSRTVGDGQIEYVVDCKIVFSCPLPDEVYCKPEHPVYQLEGLSVDLKPTDVPDGTLFMEFDTHNVYCFHADLRKWVKVGEW